MEAGARRHCKFEMNTKSSDLRESVQCPICLKLLTSPRALVCLHTFCEPCIQGLIDRISSAQDLCIQGIPCPVCREVTPPPDKQAPCSEWAKHLRKNTVILPLIEGLNAGLVISTKQASNDSDDADGLSFVHSLSFREESKSTSINCEKHPSLLIQYFCRDHMVLLCRRCVSKHKRCTDVTFTSEEEMETDIACSREVIDHALQHSLNEINKIKEALQVNTRNTETEIEDFPRRVHELQAILNRILDELCTNLEATKESSKAEHSKLQSNQLADCSSLKDGIQSYKTEFEFILQHQSLSKQFLACQNLRRQIPEFENSVAAVRNSVKFCKVKLSATELIESFIRLQEMLAKIETKHYRPDFINP